MSVEIIVAGSSLAVAVVAVGGVIKTLRANGKSAAARDERLALNQENIMEKLDDPKHGLTAINDKVNDMVNNCGRISTGLDGRVIALERDVKEVKARQNKAP